MNYAGFVDYIKEQVGDKDISASTISTHLNWAQLQVVKDLLVFEIKPRELMALDTSVSTTNGGSTITLPSHLLIYNIRVIDGTNSRVVRYLPPDEFDTKYPYPTSLSKDIPTYYTQGSKYIAELVRIPGAVYPLYIRKIVAPVDLSEAHTTSDLEDCNELITLLGVSKTFKALYELEDSVTWYKDYKEALLKEIRFRSFNPPTRAFLGSFRTREVATGDYWLNPFYKESP